MTDMGTVVETSGWWVGGSPIISSICWFSSLCLSRYLKFLI